MRKCAILGKFSTIFVADMSKMYLLCTPNSEIEQYLIILKFKNYVRN